MADNKSFFAAPNLDDEESAINPVVKPEKKDNGVSVSGGKEKAGTFFGLCDLDGNPIIPEGGNLEAQENNLEEDETPEEPSLLSDKIICYPWFERRESVGIQLRKDPYVIEKLPDIGDTPSINWLQVLAAPVSLLVIAFALMAVGLSNMLMMLPMQLVGVVTAVISYYSQKQKYSKKCTQREELYRNYLSEVETELEEIAKNQRKTLWQSNPNGSSCMDIIRDQKGILWSRDTYGEDFLEISLGVGQSELSCPIEVYRPDRFDSNVNPLSLRAVSLADQYKQITGVPVTFSLLHNNSVAVIGNKENRIAMLQQMLISLSTLHSPEDLKIAIVYSKDEERYWSFFRFLPHVWDTNGISRLISDSSAETESLLKHFADLAVSRQRAADEYHATRPSPFYVLVITNPKYLGRVPNPERLFPLSAASGLSTLVASPGSIPFGCRNIIDVKPNEKGEIVGNVYPTSEQNKAVSFSPSFLSAKDIEATVRSMAPIRLKAGKEGKGLPPFISLFKGHKVSEPKELQIEDAWKRYKAVDSMAVSLGVGNDGKELFFDIHEKHDGPMGLVAGTTRAGKTELIQTWIIQMASKFSPEEVNFVLFDFKGTSLIDPIRELPHLVGEISNTGPDDSGQDFELRYSTALNSEIIRRQNLLTLTGATNILDYQKKYHNHQVTEPMPFLMIILDEFARIKDSHPDFIKLANSLYATGGSLGMYVILSTQNPASAISPEIRANSAFQLCARVADNQDSREMIGVPDAAHLPKIPGRAFLRVRAQGTLQCFQSYYSGAAYNAKTHKSENAMPTALIELNGNAQTVKTEKPDFTELEATVEQIRHVAKAMSIPSPHKVWLPPLEKKTSIYNILNLAPGSESLRATASSALTAVVGLTDDPARQAQYFTELCFAQYGSAVVCGGPTSGKTTFLITASISMVHLYSPERVRMYYIDGGGGALSCMGKFPHTAQVLNAHMQPEKCSKILIQLQDEVKNRQQKFVSRSAQDISAYRKLTGEIIPEIFVVVDDIGEVKNSLAGIKNFSATEVVAYLLKFGPSNGVYLMISACKQQDLYKLSDNVRPEMRYVLRMPEKTDAREILGLHTNPPMLTTPGRGLYIGTSGEKRPLVFQTAQPWSVDDKSLQVSELLALGQSMADRCETMFDDQPKVIPEHIRYGSIIAPTNGIALGLALDGSGVVGNFKDSDTSVLTIVGGDSNTRMSVAEVCTKQALASGRYGNYFMITTNSDPTSILEEVRADVKARMNNENTQAASKSFLVIHDFPKVYAGLQMEYKTLMDKFILHGGTKFGIDCIFTAEAKQLADLPENDGGVTPSCVTLFRRPMLYLNNSVTNYDERYNVAGIQNTSWNNEDAEYVIGFDDERHSIRIRRMLNH